MSQSDAIVTHKPGASASIHEWVDWFWAAFLPAWVERAKDPNGFGFIDLLDQNAQPAQTNRRTILAQARLLYTFSHLALISNNKLFFDAAQIARDALPAFQKHSGGYCRARSGSGDVTGDALDNCAFSYDQSFVLLGLSTWLRLQSTNNQTDKNKHLKHSENQHEIEAQLDACWSAIENELSDPATGLLLEHDGLEDPAHSNAPPRAQNPHMHLYEAALQAFEMTNNSVWLARAQQFRAKGLEYFFDKNSGTITEFLAPDLSHLTGRDGQRREVGHQCEWAWLLLREVELSGDKTMVKIAHELLLFADKNGFAIEGMMQGAAFDAVACDASWNEPQFLLWPQTEAIKTYAIRHEQADHAKSAQSLALLIFQKYFANQAAYVNQLDIKGEPIWTDALSRLLYHLVLALTEGAQVGLWNKPK